MRHLPGVVFLIVASIPFLMLVAEEERLPAPPDDAERLVVVSPHTRRTQKEYTRGFRKWMREKHDRDVHIEWRDVGGTSKVLKEIESRFAADPTSAGIDIMFGGGVDPYIRGTADDRNWFVPVDVPDDLLSAVPKTCAGFPVYDPRGRWYGVALSGFGIVSNTILLERLGLPDPDSWEDLGDPALFGWVASGDPRSSGTVHMCYEIILQAYGFEKGWGILTRMCANVRRFGEGGSAAPLDVASGDAAVGTAIDFYCQTVINSVGGEGMRLVLPGGATVINPDAVGLLRGAPNDETARLFIAYTLTRDGQRILFRRAGTEGQRNTLHRMPVRADVYDDPDAPKTNPYDYESGMEYDASLGGRRWSIVNDLVGVRLIDGHGDLVSAWRAVIDAGAPQDLVDMLCAPPLAEVKLMDLAGKWSDSRLRQQTVSTWASDARAHYAAVRAAATARHAGPEPSE